VCATADLKVCRVDLVPIFSHASLDAIPDRALIVLNLMLNGCDEQLRSSKRPTSVVIRSRINRNLKELFKLFLVSDQSIKGGLKGVQPLAHVWLWPR